MYASTGFSNFNDIRYIFSFLSKQDNLALIASGLMLLSFCMKIGVFLCHGWTCEVLREKTSTAPLILCILRFSLALGFYKLLTSVLYHIDITEIIILLASISVIFGGVLLIFQSDLRKIIAYLAVGHAGILLLCCACKTYTAMRSLIYILLSDIISLGGILLFLTTIKKSRNRNLERLQDLCSLSKWNARVAVSLSMFWLSLFGLLPLVGFWGKYYICLALLEKHFVFPTIALIFFLLAGLICAAKLLDAIWFRESNENPLFVTDNDTVIKFINLIPYFTIIAIPLAQKIAYLMRVDLYFIR
jgi:NADH-quinone oxidoreductase subunit N